MCLKTYRVGRETLVAVCDHDILGQVFEEGKLHVEVDAAFFGQERASADAVKSALNLATIANFIGEASVRIAIELEYVDQANVLRISGIPCAQMVRM